MLKQNYDSPRWSGEVFDCAMPMTFDTYSTCSFNCLYCFAFFQKSHTVTGYKGFKNSKEREVRSVNPDRIKQMFTEALLNKKSTNNTNYQFKRYIQNRITMQWGGLADAFDENEAQYGVSLQLLKLFDKLDYPLSISTKGTSFTKDKRYMDLIKKHPHNWHFKISIINTDKKKATEMEQYVPTPKERLKAIKRLTDNNIPVTLRLRPYIIGLSDDYEELINKAANAGANSVTTEFFCLEVRAAQELKERYKKMSQIVGYDIYDFYKKNSTTHGYLRLNYNLKTKIINHMKEITHKNKMLFYVSDSQHKEKSDAVCCCGCPPDFKVFKGQYTGALQLAKHRSDHTVHWNDITKENKQILGQVNFNRAGLNTKNSQKRAKHKKQTLHEYMRDIWNTPTNLKSPVRYFEKILYPIGVDENNDVIYKYWKEKAEKQ